MLPITPAGHILRQLSRSRTTPVRPRGGRPARGPSRRESALGARRTTLRPASRPPFDVAERWRTGTQVADWAGNSVKVLLDVSANCLDGGAEAAGFTCSDR